jgi:hypothetical protein
VAPIFSWCQVPSFRCIFFSAAPPFSMASFSTAGAVVAVNNRAPTVNTSTRMAPAP